MKQRKLITSVQPAPPKLRCHGLAAPLPRTGTDLQTYFKEGHKIKGGAGSQKGCHLDHDEQDSGGHLNNARPGRDMLLFELSSPI